jgi:hypothetical protein
VWVDVNCHGVVLTNGFGISIRTYKFTVRALVSIVSYSVSKRGTRWHSWLRHCATSWKVAVSIPDGVTGIFP